MAPLQRFLFWASLITFLYAILMLFPSFRSQGGVSTTSQKGLDKSLSMTESQCAKAFPGLTDKLNRMAQRDLFDVEKIMSHVDGHAQGRITDGKLYIISVGPSDSLRRRSSTLHQIHRAIITSPDPIPDTVFSLSINDIPTNNSWTFSRPSQQTESDNYWLMPHFGFWSWAVPHVGSLDQVLDKVESIEQINVWDTKIAKAVWRGTQTLNPIANPNLRWNLLQVSKGKEWADIQATQTASESSNIIAIEDFCRYKYIIYTEGATYSGRLPYHQACTSVIITTPLLFHQHATHLIRPLYSNVALSSPKTRPVTVQNPPNSSPAFPTSYPVESANMVFVAEDWSDLEPTIVWLEQNPEFARQIAQNQQELMVNEGYLSEAADTCYWRALIRRWARVARPKEDGPKAWGNRWKNEGMRFETFALEEKVDWT